MTANSTWKLSLNLIIKWTDNHITYHLGIWIFQLLYTVSYIIFPSGIKGVAPFGVRGQSYWLSPLYTPRGYLNKWSVTLMTWVHTQIPTRSVKVYGQILKAVCITGQLSYLFGLSSTSSTDSHDIVDNWKWR